MHGKTEYSLLNNGRFACSFALLLLGIAPLALAVEQQPTLVLAFDNTPLAAGADHSAVRCANSMVFTWGHNDLGQLGDGTGLDAYSPVVVRDEHLEPLTGTVALTSGANHLLALREDGSVLGWGDNSLNQVTDTVWATPYASLYKEAPGSYQGSYQQAPGAYQGNYRLGPDGTGSTILEYPAQVMEAAGGPIGEVREISASGDLSVALRVDGSAVAWGDTGFLQVAQTSNEPVVATGSSATTDTSTASTTDSSTSASSEPSMTILLNVDGEPVTGLLKIAVGAQHIVGLSRTGRVLYWKTKEILARREQTDASLRARYVTDESDRIINSAVDVAAAGEYSLALLRDTRVVAWGSTDIDLFGEGGLTLLPVGGGADATVEDVVQADATDTGSAGTDTALVTTAVDPEKARYVKYINGDRLSNVQALAASDTHALFLLHNGHVVAAGDNTNGELGDGTNTNSMATDNIVAVTDGSGKPLSRIVAIASGENHSLALSGDGYVYAWGGGSSGQLGDGSNVASYYATPVRDLSNQPFNINFSCIPVY